MKNLIVLFFLITASLFAQELDCNVDVDAATLPENTRKALEHFAEDVSNYMNTTWFTEGDRKGDKIPCSLKVFIIKSNEEDQYSAMIYVSSDRNVYQSEVNVPMLRIKDEQWNFTYYYGQDLTARLPEFDPLTSLLQFYAYLIIGYDSDAWEELGGDKYFDKAREIVDLGVSSGFAAGWQEEGADFTYDRSDVIYQLRNIQYQPFRKAFYYYHYGVDAFYQNKVKGQKLIADALNQIYQIDGIDYTDNIVTMFFNAQHGEIVNYLSDYPDRNSIMKKLIEIDPVHQDVYEKNLGE